VAASLEDEKGHFAVYCSRYLDVNEYLIKLGMDYYEINCSVCGKISCATVENHEN